MENVNRDEEEARHLTCLYMLQYFRENGYTWFADELVRLANIDESEPYVLDPPTLRELIEQETLKKDTSLGNASTIAQTQTTTNNPTVDQLRKIIDGMHLSPRLSIDQEDNAYAMDSGLEKSPPPHSELLHVWEISDGNYLGLEQAEAPRTNVQQFLAKKLRSNMARLIGFGSNRKN